VYCLINIRHENQGPARRVSLREISHQQDQLWIGQNTKNHCQGSKSKSRQEIEHLPNQQRRMEEIETLVVLLLSDNLPFNGSILLEIRSLEHSE
jgi:hypothetical protein